MRIVCPTCKKVVENAPADLESRPFCSRLCKLSDLNDWLSERFVVSEPAFLNPDEDDHVH